MSTIIAKSILCATQWTSIKKGIHVMFDLNCDSIAHSSKHRPCIHSKWHQHLAHCLNIHIPKLKKTCNNTWVIFSRVSKMGICLHVSSKHAWIPNPTTTVVYRHLISRYGKQHLKPLSFYMSQFHRRPLPSPT